MILLVVYCIYILAAVNGQSVQVNTFEGIVEGYKASDGEYYTFHGIPYAVPVVGPDMFKPSDALHSLPGLLHANNSNIRCAHPGSDGMIGIVDCLVLNVFTSNPSTSRRRPVLVWLNGDESDATISSQYTYKRLIEKEVVVVTLNYRLSVFGFLCLRTQDHPGNAGLKDVILGLKWVKRNIVLFGGDLENLVLIGHGSAAAVVEIITLLPSSKNLIQKAIALSGSAIAPWAVSYDPIGAALTINSVLNGSLETIDHIATTLSSHSLSEINNVLNKFKYTNNTAMFAPCIERADEPNALLVNDPINLIRSISDKNDIPYMVAYATREGTIRAKEAKLDGWVEKMQSNFIEFLPVDLDFANKLESNAETIRNFYFDGYINMSSIDSYLRYHGDTMFVVPVIRGLRERVAASANDVWLLEFGYMGTNNSDWNLHEIPLNGARHGSILNYIFDIDLVFSLDKIVAESIVTRITAFAYTGIPTDGRWSPRPFTLQSPDYLSYYGSGEAGLLQQFAYTNPQEATMSFWEPFYNSYYAASSSASGINGLVSVVLLSSILLI